MRDDQSELWCDSIVRASDRDGHLNASRTALPRPMSIRAKRDAASSEAYHIRAQRESYHIMRASPVSKWRGS